VTTLTGALTMSSCGSASQPLQADFSAVRSATSLSFTSNAGKVRRSALSRSAHACFPSFWSPLLEAGNAPVAHVPVVALCHAQLVVNMTSLQTVSGNTAITVPIASSLLVLCSLSCV
jgi:hypothetical protein